MVIFYSFPGPSNAGMRYTLEAIVACGSSELPIHGEIEKCITGGINQENI